MRTLKCFAYIHCFLSSIPPFFLLLNKSIIELFEAFCIILFETSFDFGCLMIAMNRLDSHGCFVMDDKLIDKG